jgi:predicted DNA-binding protein
VDKQHIVNIRVSEGFFKKLEQRIDAINKADPHGRRLTKSVFIRSIVERELEEDSDE